jgi:hypothetical protein
MDCRMPLAKEEKTSGKANNLLLSFFLRVYLKSRKYGLFLQTQRDFALRQYRTILSADTASEVPQPPKRCLSR